MKKHNNKSPIMVSINFYTFSVIGGSTFNMGQPAPSKEGQRY